MGLKRTGCILAAMLPLLCRARGSDDHATRDDALPPERRIGPVPSWVFDMHTRGGLAAFGRYRRHSERMRAFLAEHADPTANLTRVVGDLVFGMESGLLKRRLLWEEGTRLNRAVHLVQPGLLPEAIPEAYAILREEIDLLNQYRAEAAPDYLR